MSNPAREVTSDVTGKTCLVTGANTGIGRVTAIELANAGADVYLACRSLERTQPVIDEIKELTGKDAKFLKLDLSSLASVRECAEAFLAEGVPLHVLIENAGIAGKKGLTVDGFELAFGTNHLGHFLLTLLLLDKLKESAPSRIVVVSSRGHRKAKAIHLDRVRKPTKTWSGFPEYCESKGANILFASELGRRLEGTGVTTYSLHPGVVASDVWREVPWPFRSLIKLRMISNEEGARTTLYCATAPELESVTGRYYDECKEEPPFPPADDDALARELWDKSLEWVGLEDPLPRRQRASA